MVTLLLLVFWPRNGFGCWDQLSGYINTIRSIGRSLVVPTKEKNDEDADYEMVWDAEGSLHLVRKATPQVPVAQSDLGSAARSSISE